jgi:hypothetical protein
VSSLSLPPSLTRVFHLGHPKPLRVYPDLQALLDRMRHRLYPETLPVLASYWLTTVYSSGHNRPWWVDVNGQLKEILAGPGLDAPSREALADIQGWIQNSFLPTGKTPAAHPRVQPPFRADLAQDRLSSYICRLLNEWLPAEVASLLTNESEPVMSEDGGIPVLAEAKALERLLVRERLSPGALEMLLQPDLLSPKDVYPADAEILRDIVLSLLGRTSAPLPPVMPAALVGVAAGSALHPDFGEAVARAFLVRSEGREEVHVPIEPRQAVDILKHDPVRIGSIIATMDGRWWHAESLESGDQHFIVYAPGARLRIDFTEDYARLTVPWPVTQLHWPGAARLGGPFEIFGREWRPASWETDGEHSYLHLSFSRILPVAESPASEDAFAKPLRTAAADMAWSELEQALTRSLLQKSSEPVEQLRRTDLIPFGRAVYELADSLHDWRPNKEKFQTRLRALVYLQAEVSLTYGRVPWRVVPASIRATLVKRRLDPASIELLQQTFDELPEVFSAAPRKGPSSAPSEHSNSPSQAA